MNVYQRPLFRQMGGPVAPGMAMQEAMPPAMGGQDPMMALQQAETMAAQQTAGIGEQYAMDTLANIDRAETPEQIINALRGNEVPLEQRYAELAQFVGEADAQRTPESVLALVQPTIMMTEQGAMDSGIGELMQGMTGDIAMETPGGQPTEMGQGIGSLMMAGAPATPEMGVGQQPVANFRQGGVVQRFQTGGEASRLQALYSEMLPVYQGILGDGSDQRRMTQAQILFDIADRAGAFAAGIDPRTGQSVAGLSPAAQFATAASGLGGQIGERLGSQEQQDRALRLAALQAAQGEFSAERAAARAASAGGRDRALGSLYDIYDAEGNLVQQGVPIATQSEYARVMENVPGGRITASRAPETGSDITTLYSRETGEPVSFFTSSSQGRGQVQEALNSGDFVAVPPPKPGEQVILYDSTNPETGIPAIVGTPQYNQLTAEGYRTAQDIVAQRNLTAPPDMITYVNREDNNDFVRVVRGSPEEGAALARNMVPVSDAVSLAGLTPSDTGIGKSYDVVDPATGEVVATTFLSTRAQLDELEAQYPGMRIQESRDAETPDLVSFELPGVNGGPATTVIVDKASAEGRAQIAQIQQIPGARQISVTAAQQTSPLIQPDLMRRYGRNETTPEETALIQAEIAKSLRSVFNPETGQFERPSITPLVLQEEQARRNLGVSTVLTLAEPGGPSPEGQERVDRLEALGGAGFGAGARVRDIINRVVSPTGLVPAPQTQDAINAVNALHEDAKVAFRDLLQGRPAQDAIDQFAETLPDPAIFFDSPRNAASKIQSILDLYNSNIAAARDMAASGLASATMRADLERAIISAQRMVDAYSALRTGILSGGTGSDVDPAQFRRPM